MPDNGVSTDSDNRYHPSLLPFHASTNSFSGSRRMYRTPGRVQKRNRSVTWISDGSRLVTIGAMRAYLLRPWSTY